MKVKRIAAQQIQKARKEAGKDASKEPINLDGAPKVTRDSWVNKQDAGLLRPKDEKTLQEELKAVR